MTMPDNAPIQSAQPDGEFVGNRIRVLLATKSRELCESLRNLIQSQMDMEVVGEAFSPIELLLAVDQMKADVVIIEMLDSDQDPGICSHLLAEYPELLILALTPERESAYLFRQRIIREPLCEVADENILLAIRQVDVRLTD